MKCLNFITNIMRPKQLRNISENIKVDEVLKESGKNYRKIVNLSPDAIVITIAGIIELANHQAMEFLKNPIGEELEKYVAPNFIMTLRKSKSYIMANKTNKLLFDCKMTRKDGSLVDVEISSNFFSYKGREAILSLIRDVSERNKEMNAAAKYQLSDLQKPFPISDRACLETLYIPAKVISGDFYYFHKVSDNLVVGLLGDFCGKSFKAALGISAFNVLFHEAVLVTQKPDEILKIINKKTAYYFNENYVAAICFSFDFKSNKAVVAGAGINQFIIQRQNQVACIKTVKGSYLGMFDNSDFEKLCVDFKTGDRFCFFSDGLDDTMLEDKVKECFAKERSICELIGHIKNNITEMMSEVNGFKDDCTLLLLEMG